MTIKSYRLIISLLLIAFVSSNLIAIDRTEQKRLLQYTLSWSNSGIGSGYEVNNYFYRIDNPELIDSIGIIESWESNSVSRNTWQCIGNSQESNGNKQIEYFINVVGQNTPYLHYYYFLDPQGRTIRYRVETWNTEANNYILYEEIYRHYNSIGFADSVYYHTYSGSGDRYFKRNFEGTVLQNTVVYYGAPSNWIPYAKYNFTYSENPVVLPAFIRFDNLRGSYFFNDDLFLLEAEFNPKCLPDSISVDTWNSNAWHWNYHYTNTETVSNNEIILYTHLNDPENFHNDSYTYHINMAGDVIQKYHQWSGNEESGGIIQNYIWDTIVSTDDNLLPTPANSLKAYPNPFRQDLTIALDSKDNALIDISIFNVKGQLVRECKAAKGTEFIWDGKDKASQPVGSGIYLIKSLQGRQSAVAKVIRL